MLDRNYLEFPYGYEPGDIRHATLALTLADGRRWIEWTEVTVWAVESGGKPSGRTEYIPVRLLITCAANGNAPCWIELRSDQSWIDGSITGRFDHYLRDYKPSDPKGNSVEIMAAEYRKLIQLRKQIRLRDRSGA